MKTVADVILSYYILYHYFKISKIYQKLMQPSNQAQAVMLMYYWRAPHNFKTIEWKPKEEMHLSLTIYYTIILKKSKIRKKYKNGSIVKRSTNQAVDIVLDACMKLENYPIKTVGRICILPLLYRCDIVFGVRNPRIPWKKSEAILGFL